MKKSNIDLVVGLFLIGGLLSFVYMSLKLGEFSIFAMEKNYSLNAEFSNTSGLKRGASVEIAGVPVGTVLDINLSEDDRAKVTMLIRKDVLITEDAIASVKTQGIIGEKFVKITQGGAEETLKDGDLIFETESALDLESLVSKYIFGNVNRKGF